MPIISQSFQLIWIEVAMLLKLVCLMNVILSFISLDQFWRERTLVMRFLQKNRKKKKERKKISVGFCLDNYKLNSFKLGMIIETTKLYILITVLMILTVNLGHSHVRNQALLHPFSCKFLSWLEWSSVCCHNLLVCRSSCSICLHDLYSRERTPFTWFHEIDLQRGPALGHL